MADKGPMMYIVAVYKLQGTPEQLAQDLAAALGTTPYEAGFRVTIPGGGRKFCYV